MQLRENNVRIRDSSTAKLRPAAPRHPQQQRRAGGIPPLQ